MEYLPTSPYSTRFDILAMTSITTKLTPCTENRSTLLQKRPLAVSCLRLSCDIIILIYHRQDRHKGHRKLHALL